MSEQALDFEPGREVVFGSYDVTRAEVLEFAAKYDPQPFHLSDDAAAASPFGRLAASGWHSCAMAMAVIARFIHDHGQAGLGAGIDDLRWLEPVYPGDRLTISGRVLDVRPSRSKPRLQIVRTQVLATNQHGAPVMRYVSTVLYRRGEP